MRKITCIATAVWLTGVMTAVADSRVSGPIAVEVLGVQDGDTLAVLAHMWPEQYIKTHVRLAGVDTPEMRGRCERERELARQAKALTEKFLLDGAPISIRNVQLDKYGGRVDADVMDAHGRSLAATLMTARLAAPYNGGAKQGWCP